MELTNPNKATVSDYTYRYKTSDVVNRCERVISLSSLSEKQQRAVWEGIKKLNPEFARLITDDKNIQQTKEQMASSLMLTVSDLNRYYDAGFKFIEERNNVRTNKNR